MRPSLRLWRRVFSSVLVFTAVLIVQVPLHTNNYVEYGLMVLEEKCGLLPPTPGASYRGLVGSRSFPMPSDSVERVNTAASVLALLLPSLWVTIAVYHVITFRRRPADGATRCGHCGSVLKGLARPECTACLRPL